MKYLLDTSVVQELISKQPNPNVINFVDSLDPEDTFLSVITVGEISRAIEHTSDTKRKAEIRKWLYESLFSRFEGNIIPLDAEIFMRWGEMTAKLEKIGAAQPTIEGLLAATVLVHEMVLVTKHEGEFEGTGIEVIVPW